jgi:hypothetical protein
MIRPGSPIRCVAIVVATHSVNGTTSLDRGRHKRTEREHLRVATVDLRSCVLVWWPCAIPSRTAHCRKSMRVDGRQRYFETPFGFSIAQEFHAVD